MYLSDLSPKEYHTFYSPYIRALGNERPLLEVIEATGTEFKQYIDEIPEEKLSYAYDRGKWTVAEVLQHIIDAERVFAYRALRFSRGDTTPLPGFDQDAYILPSKANSRSLSGLLEEFVQVRASSFSLFRSFDNTMLKTIGTASGSPMSVRALGFILAGHQSHHQKTLKERYLQT